jgi:hypothetical protein
MDRSTATAIFMFSALVTSGVTLIAHHYIHSYDLLGGLAILFFMLITSIFSNGVERLEREAKKSKGE